MFAEVLFRLAKDVQTIDADVKELAAADEAIRRTEKMGLKVSKCEGFHSKLTVKIDAAVQRQMTKLDEKSVDLNGIIRTVMCMSSGAPTTHTFEEDSLLVSSYCSELKSFLLSDRTGQCPSITLPVEQAMSEPPCHVPSLEFVKKMCKFKERNDWPPTISGEVDYYRSNYHNQYFPYNGKICRAMFADKHVMFIGDSLVRAMYKDMVSLLRTGELCSPRDLRVTNEDCFQGDKQIDNLELEANRVFRQAREFQSNRHLVQYFFTNRAMREDLEKLCLMLEASDEKPDVVVVNSAIWDISRFPARHSTRRSEDLNKELFEEINVAEEYFNRIAMLCRRMRLLLPPTSTVVWLLMPPNGTPEINRGFCSYNKLTFDEIRTRLLDANVRAAQVVREAGFDVLDISFHMRHSSYQVFRIKDGVHWNVVATRFMNQLLLGHLACAWRIERVVQKKWKASITQKTYRETRSQIFKCALDFLKNMNKKKHINERTQQHVRVISLENFNRCNPMGMSATQFMESMRVLLMFYKYQQQHSDKSVSLAKAFGVGQLPPELSRYSQEDIVKIGKMIHEVTSTWRDRLPPTRMGHRHKRKLERRALLPTPSAPPGISFSRNEPHKSIAPAERRYQDHRPHSRKKPRYESYLPYSP
ncbi:unnamed protein product [Caenorhabditis sp. 36 PRJEB53466]|nr:unnamed protein product [Caenorhabditis sp. 36 PRJEB53466]